MPGSNFPRLHVWSDNEDVNASDLNAEFNNVLNNLNPAGMDGYQDNSTQMQKQTDPGAVGAEILATSLGGEVERLRFKINQIIGKTYWYQNPAVSLNDVNTQLASLSPLNKNRVVSGRTRTTSNQPLFIVPNAGTLSVNLKAATTNLIYYVNGTVYTASTDTTITGLTSALGSNNTCLVNSAALAGQEYTRTLGEYGSSIPVASMQPNILAVIGQYAAFKLVSAGKTEYFVGYVESSTKISRAVRGYFFDSSDVPSTRIPLSNNDTITLLRLTYVFINTAGSLAVTYNPPITQKKTPAGASVGDYWYDTKSNVWSVYNGTSFAPANATFAGVCAQDSAGCVAARSIEFYALYADTDTINLEWLNNSQIRSNSPSSQVSVAGNAFIYTDNFLYFNMPADLDLGLVEQASTAYFLYITDQGDSVISDKSPYDRRADLKGMYHPHNPWRCVGRVFNSASSNFDPLNLVTEHLQDLPTEFASKVITAASQVVPVGYVAADGTALNRVIYSALFARTGIIHGQGDNATTFNLPDYRGEFLRGINAGSGRDPDAASRTAMAAGGATGDSVGSVQAGSNASHSHSIADHAHVANAQLYPATIFGSGFFVWGEGGTHNTSNTSPASLSIGAAGGSESRPMNAYVLYLVKY